MTASRTAASDALLRSVAKRMERIGRAIDTAARLGGNEFVMLLSGFEDPKGAEIFALKLLASIREPVILEGHPIHPGVSLGVASFPQPCEEPGQLLRCADEAMYTAKRAGGNRIVLWEPDVMRELVEAPC